MKSSKGFRVKDFSSGPDDVVRKAVKLALIKKSGKEKHHIFSSIEEDDDLSIHEYKRRESVLDYFDDAPEDQFDEEFTDDDYDEEDTGDSEEDFDDFVDEEDEI